MLLLVKTRVSVRDSVTSSSQELQRAHIAGQFSFWMHQFPACLTRFTKIAGLQKIYFSQKDISIEKQSVSGSGDSVPNLIVFSSNFECLFCFLHSAVPCR